MRHLRPALRPVAPNRLECLYRQRGIYVSKEAYSSVKIYVSKEAYSSVKRGLFCEKRPTVVAKEAYTCQKRPIVVAKEAYSSGKRGL